MAPREQRPVVKWILTVGLLLAAVICLLLLCLFIGTQNYSMERMRIYFELPLILLMNFLPMLLLLGLCYAMTNRAWISWLITSVFFLLFFFINYFKVALRGEPFVADDFFVAGDGLSILDEYTLHIPKILWLSLLAVALGAVLLARYARGRVPKHRWWIRPIIAAVCIAIGLTTWFTLYRDETLYRSTRLKTQSVFSAFRDEEISASAGLVWSFLRTVDELSPSAPDGYSKADSEAMLAETPDVLIPESQRVNVVVTMLESYSDLSVFDGVRFTADPYAEIHALRDESYSGTLIVDSIGGGTINAERSFLTGFSYPQPKYRRNTQSFVRYFSENGYTTVGAHPGVGSFYSRISINKAIGFDDFLFYRDGFSELATEDNTYGKTSYLNDAAFFAELRRIYERRDTSTPYFSFSVTYQGHSPYSSSALDGGEYVSHDGLSDEAYCIVNNYLNSVAQTGKAVAEYVDTFRDDEEPVVLVFFGDHKPTLGSGYSYYEDMGIISDKLSGPEIRSAIYSTPYLIWANDAAKEVLGKDFSGTGETISPCYLMSILFDCCGWEGSSWIQNQRSLRQALPVLHYGRYFLVDGALTDQLPDALAPVYRKYSCLEYYLRQQIPS